MYFILGRYCCHRQQRFLVNEHEQNLKERNTHSAAICYTKKKILDAALFELRFTFIKEKSDGQFARAVIWSYVILPSIGHIYQIVSPFYFIFFFVTLKKPSKLYLLVVFCFCSFR